MTWFYRFSLAILIAVPTLLIVAIVSSFFISTKRNSDVLYLTYSATIRSLDPAVCSDEIGRGILANVYETLYVFRETKEGRQLVPNLAVAPPTLSDDGLTLAIRLRPGVRFYGCSIRKPQDGEELTAEDVVYSWKRVANFAAASANYSILFQGNIAGIDDWYEYTRKCTLQGQHIDYTQHVVGLTVKGRYDIHIRLTHRMPYFSAMLAYAGSAVISRSAAEPIGAPSARLVGTGPYFINSYRPGEVLELRRNPCWHGWAEENLQVSKPFESVEYHYFSEPVVAWQAFRQGLFDIATVPKEALPELRAQKDTYTDPPIAVFGVDEPNVIGYTFNLNDPIVGPNVELRHAMSMALDRAEFVKTLRPDVGLPAYCMIPPAFADHRASNKHSPWLQYDLESARRTIAAIEKDRGEKLPKLNLLMPGTDIQSRQDAEFFIRQMKMIGLDVKAEYTSWANFQDRVRNGSVQIFQNGWIAKFPDSMSFYMLFYGPASAEGLNTSHMVNAEYDNLFRQLLEADPASQLALRGRMLDIVDYELPWIRVFYPRRFIAFGPRVEPVPLSFYTLGSLAQIRQRAPSHPASPQ